MTGSVLITRISELVTNAPEADPGAGGASRGGGAGEFALIRDAALIIEGDRIAWVGPASRAPAADTVLDAGERAVLPGFVDSHAHLVFAGDRSAEFAARMAGRPYTAGGIRSTVAATRAATDAELRAGLHRLAREMLRQGTTTFECKSGYGLTVADEARSVALAAEFTPEVTYLGAHVVPAEFDGDPGGYVDLVCGPMLDACAPHSRWIDVFCERGAFGPAEARAVLTAGQARGLIPRLHASQLGPGPGVLLAVELDAASVDHCTFLTDNDIAALAAAAPSPGSPSPGSPSPGSPSPGSPSTGSAFAESRSPGSLPPPRSPWSSPLPASPPVSESPSVPGWQSPRSSSASRSPESPGSPSYRESPPTLLSAPARSGTVATLLPGAEFGTRQPYPDARRLLDAGVTVALATDCNPGSSYTSSMPFCLALAVRDLHMTPAEAVWAATAGGARALRRTDIGYLAPGARADLIILDAPSYIHLAYRPGVPLIHAVYRSGRLVSAPATPPP